MKKLYFLLITASLGIAQMAQAQFVWQESFTGQTNFGNPTGWDNIDGFTTWNVYETHGNPSFGLTRSFQVGQSDAIATSSSSVITIPLNAQLIVDARVMAFSLYPSSAATLPVGASLTIAAFDGLTTAVIVTLDASNQNTDTGWITLSGSMNAVAGSQVQLIITGNNGPNGPADYFIDLDNFRVTDGTVGIADNTTPSNMSVYPNPATDKIFVSSVTGQTNVTVSSILGNTVIANNTIANGTLEVDIQNLDTGMYFVMVQNEGKTFTKKINVQ